MAMLEKFGNVKADPHPFVPAKAGTQFLLDSRLRGNERKRSDRID
jgi:hypothetical protein